ncbi:MAG: hypothetical protein HN542_03765 [Flavobacteriales bacterium]|jgi:hypothetical protein|nr:hypothetical protein [Flavobacteriales bacterium]NCG29878.1 hypothetical protein [Bacteroidota bacterium]MBT3963488.1 hypothetical protein [Flavobacteriales bacterium]MBT4705126.1 hypothetical protein [Flavobacteriales bacterium]MBT4930146.1 hypothetical protein [Flavobacteriales bacterium]
MKTTTITIAMILFGFGSMNAFAEGKDTNTSKCPNSDMGKLTTVALNTLDMEVSQIADSLLESSESSGVENQRDEDISKEFEMTMTSIQAGKAAEGLNAEFDENAK